MTDKMKHTLMYARNTSLTLLLLISYMVIALYCPCVIALKHHLVLTNDVRSQVSVSSFGYNLLGRLEVIVQNLTLSPDPLEENNTPQYGFAIIKSNQARNPYAAKPNQQVSQQSCLINNPITHFNYDLMILPIIPQNGTVEALCSDGFPMVETMRYDPSQRGSHEHSSYKHTYEKRSLPVEKSLSKLVDHDFIPEERYGIFSQRMTNCSKGIPLTVRKDAMDRNIYSFNFTFLVERSFQEGNYYLSFQNCRGAHNFDDHASQTRTRFNLSMLILETNYPINFLSAGAMPLPQMYFMLSIMFFLSGCVWINYVSHQKENMLKIHNLMTVLVLAKAFSLLFHGINYHYIALDGQPVVTWAYLYYATRAVKGALFFITLALIGSGWTFIKHILSPRDKTMIMAIVALQIIAHIAEILLDQSTEGQVGIEFWWELCGLVDLFSCIFILLPITWSVRHLEGASKTDGKAAINLKKLELFKSFYIISTIYIYVTRIMTFVFLSMLSYKYSWLAELFSELATLIYFVVTGYYFQPMPMNPYLLLSSDIDTEEDILFSVVDATEMDQSIRFDPSESQTDRNALLGDEAEGNKTTKRRNVEELV